MWLELLLLKAKGILFGTFYRPPSQSDFLNPFQEVLELANAENKETLITGDLISIFWLHPLPIQQKT